MRRGDFLKLTGLSADKFDSRARRRELPFWWLDEKSKGGQANYRPFDAFLTLLSERLADRGPLLEDAATAIRFLASDLQRDWDAITSSLQAPDYFVLWAEVDCPEPGHPLFTVREYVAVSGSTHLVCAEALQKKTGGRRIRRSHGVNTYQSLALLHQLADDYDINIEQVF